MPAAPIPPPPNLELSPPGPCAIATHAQHPIIPRHLTPCTPTIPSVPFAHSVPASCPRLRCTTQDFNEFKTVLESNTKSAHWDAVHKDISVTYQVGSVKCEQPLALQGAQPHTKREATDTTLTCTGPQP